MFIIRGVVVFHYEKLPSAWVFLLQDSFQPPIQLGGLPTRPLARELQRAGLAVAQDVRQELARRPPVRFRLIQVSGLSTRRLIYDR